MSTYNRLPVDLVKGNGAQVWDADGKQYLDALGGIAVCALGHAHPEISKTICEQAGKIMHCSNIYGIPAQRELGEKLCQISGMDKVFFGNSGAEANEAAIKIARMYGNKKNIKNPTIIVTEGAFHGRTLATLTATGNRKVQAGFEPLVQGFVRAPYGDLDAINTIAESASNIVGVLVEPIQGEGGINIPDDDYLPGIRKICDDNEWLMMLDEIQTGMCRTGEWFAFQHYDIKPDIMTVAKSLGNGMPIGACLASGKAADVFQPGNHGSTYGGNPLACQTALSVVGVMEKNQLKDRANELGQRILQGFVDNLKDCSGINEIRGKGLMIGIELTQPCTELVGMALEEGILINVTANNTIRLLPPLIISDEEADLIVSKVCAVINRFISQ